MTMNLRNGRGGKKRIDMTLILETIPFKCYRNCDVGFIEKEN